MYLFVMENKKPIAIYNGDNVEELRERAEKEFPNREYEESETDYVVPAEKVEPNLEKIAKLQAELSATDYKCLKYVDGALSDEEYAEVRAYRAELRAKINELQRTE